MPRPQQEVYEDHPDLQHHHHVVTDVDDPAAASRLVDMSRGSAFDFSLEQANQTILSVINRCMVMHTSSIFTSCSIPPQHLSDLADFLHYKLVDIRRQIGQVNIIIFQSHHQLTRADGW